MLRTIGSGSARPGHAHDTALCARQEALGAATGSCTRPRRSTATEISLSRQACPVAKIEEKKILTLGNKGITLLDLSIRIFGIYPLGFSICAYK